MYTQIIRTLSIIYETVCQTNHDKSLKLERMVCMKLDKMNHRMRWTSGKEQE